LQAFFGAVHAAHATRCPARQVLVGKASLGWKAMMADTVAARLVETLTWFRIRPNQVTRARESAGL
jgi:hypothetical protein